MTLKKPNRQQISLLESALLMEAYIETIRPTIDAIYNDVLFYMIPKHITVDKRTGEAITHHKDLYRVEDMEYLEKYYQEARKVMIEKGFKPEKEGNCHLLESESLLRDLNRQYIQACIETLPEMILQGKSKEEFFTSLTYNMKLYDRFLEINKSYMIQFVDKKRILAA